MSQRGVGRRSIAHEATTARAAKARAFVDVRGGSRYVGSMSYLRPLALALAAAGVAAPLFGASCVSYGTYEERITEGAVTTLYEPTTQFGSYLTFAIKPTVSASGEGYREGDTLPEGDKLVAEMARQMSGRGYQEVLPDQLPDLGVEINYVKLEKTGVVSVPYYGTGWYGGSYWGLGGWYYYAPFTTTATWTTGTVSIDVYDLRRARQSGASPDGGAPAADAGRALVYAVWSSVLYGLRQLLRPGLPARRERHQAGLRAVPLLPSVSTMRSLRLATFVLTTSSLALVSGRAMAQYPEYSKTYEPAYPTVNYAQPASQPAAGGGMQGGGNRGRALFSLSWSLAVPVGTITSFTGDTSPRGLDMQARFFVLDWLSVGGTFAWNHFFQKRPNETYQRPDGQGAITATFYNTFEAFSLMGNVHAYMRPRGFLLPFVGVGLGTVSATHDTQLVDLHERTNGWYFGVAPELGVSVLQTLRSGQRGGFFFSFRYTYAPTSGAVTSDAQWFSFNFGTNGGW